jgi:predicted nucleic acid-binding protein
LVTVLNKEYPLYSDAARILSLADDRKHTLVTTAICLAIAFYFAEKKHGTTQAKKKITMLAEHIEIAYCGADEVSRAAADKRVHDFEDGLEYYAAFHAGCHCIVTENRDDFYFSTLEVLDAGQFLKKYIARNKY